MCLGVWERLGSFLGYDCGFLRFGIVLSMLYCIFVIMGCKMLGLGITFFRGIL